MRRYALPLILAGATALLLGLVFLWKSIGGETVAPHVEVQRSASGPAQTVAPTTAPAPTGPAVARAPLPPSIQSRSSDSAPALESPTPPAPSQDSPPPGSPLNTKNLEWGISQMRAQAAANEPKVRECLAKAAASGDKPTGEATLTFIAAKRGNKIVIEDTSVDPEGTTLKGDSLLDCLHATSKAMTFQGLPREATAVMVTRTIKVQNGELVENAIPKFNYIN